MAEVQYQGRNHPGYSLSDDRSDYHLFADAVHHLDDAACSNHVKPDSVSTLGVADGGLGQCRRVSRKVHPEQIPA